MRACSACRRGLDDEFRFCPYCGEPQRTKIVEYFRGHRELDDGDLRASVYLIAPRHVRLSVWRGERAEAAISLDADEAHRLGRFLLAATPPAGGPLRRGARVLTAAAHALSRR